QIVVNYEWRWPESKTEIPMSFFVHPLLHDQWLACPPPDLAAPRPWRIFFSGRATDPKYGSNVLPKKFGKLSRRQVLQAVEADLPAGRLKKVQGAADLNPGAVQQPAFV